MSMKLSDQLRFHIRAHLLKQAAEKRESPGRMFVGGSGRGGNTDLNELYQHDLGADTKRVDSFAVRHARGKTGKPHPDMQLPKGTTGPMWLNRNYMHEQVGAESRDKYVELSDPKIHPDLVNYKGSARELGGLVEEFRAPSQGWKLRDVAKPGWKKGQGWLGEKGSD